VKSKLLVSALIALALVGCGAQQRSAFGYQFADNQEADLSAVIDSLPAPRPDDRPRSGVGHPIAVVATHADEASARRIAAVRVDTGEELWSAAHDAATRPEILGDVVLSTTRDQLVAFDAASGRVLWRTGLPDLAYVGAARDGSTIFWAATVGALGGARRVGHVVAVDARSGDEVWRHEVNGVFGRPAAAGGLVFVPWERQNIAVLDGRTGVERARLRSTDDVISWAFDHPTGIYYGGRGIYRLTPRSVSGTREGSTHERLALGELPRQPESIWPDGYLPEPGARSARGRIRVYFEPTVASGADQLAIESDTYYFAYYRYVFAFNRQDGALRWTRILEQDVINAEVLPHGLIAVGEQGRVTLLDRDTGADRWTRDLSLQLASVALDVGAFDPGASEVAPRPLRQSLNELVLDPDNRLVAARAFAVSRLAQLEEAEVTRDLLDLYQQRSMPGALKEAIREALRTRRSGAQYLMDALARRYDYLEDTQSPPLEAIVPALLEMRHTPAVARLVNHMMDHETPAEVLPQVVDAVVRLGGPEAVPALRSFLVLYQADSTFQGPVADQEAAEGRPAVRASPEARALAVAAAGIFEHGGPAGRELLASLSGQGARTHEPVAAHIQGLYRSEAEAQERARREQELAAQRALEEQQRQVEEALPLRLSQDQINTTFAENADTLRDCIAGEIERNPRLAQVRMVFILSGDGEASELTVSPNTPQLVECMQERVATVRFPRFRARRMRGSFTVSIRGGAPVEPETSSALAALPDDAPWWAWAQRRATVRGATAEVPAVAAWWAPREAPVQAEPTQTPVLVEEPELPPGMAPTVGERPTGRPTGPATRPGSGEPTQGGTRPAQAGTSPSQGQEQPGQGGTAPAQGTPPSQGGTQPAQGGGTPWWAGAGAEEDEEAPAPAPEEQEPRRAPPRRPRR
jgi:outer membrane protein assembly factor BamB